MRKKATKRSKKKYPALDRTVNLKSRYDLIDYDYLNKLSDKELKFLNKFTEEFINASFSKDNKKNLHKKSTEKKEIYNRNNARNRDILTRAKITGTLANIEDIIVDDTVIMDEDLMIEMIDDTLLKKSIN